MSTQYEYRDGVWWDTYNDQPAEAWGDWTLSALIVNACGCVADQIAEMIAEYLSSEDDGMVWLDGTVERLLIATMADNEGFTEHGSSMSGCWLTDAGRSWLELYRSEQTCPTI